MYWQYLTEQGKGVTVLDMKQRHREGKVLAENNRKRKGDDSDLQEARTLSKV